MAVSFMYAYTKVVGPFGFRMGAETLPPAASTYPVALKGYALNYVGIPNMV